MPSFYASGKRGYGLIKRETTAGTPVRPTQAFYLQTEDVMSPFENENVDVAADSRAENYFIAPGKNAAPAGSITMPIQPDTFGFFLAGMFGTPTTSALTDSAYTHQFTSNNSGNIPTFTVELGNGDATYARRYIGCRFGGLQITQKGNTHYAQLQLMCRYSFVSARLTAAILAGATTAELDTNYGLVIGDTFKLGFGTDDVETVTLTAVNANGTTIEFAATSNAHDADDYCVLASRTPSYATATPHMSWIGGTTTKIGNTLGTAAAVARFNEFSLNFDQKLEADYAPNGDSDFSRYPVDIMVSSYAASVAWSWVHRDVEYLDAMRKRKRLAIDVTVTGDAIGVTSKNTLRIEAPKLVLDPSGAPLGGSDIVRERHSGRLQYSASDGFDVRLTLVNAVATH
jgi:hypothetical protein